METFDYIINVGNPDRPVLVDFYSDIHIGTKNCSLTALDRAMRDTKRVGAFVIGGGDYCDSIIPSDSRYDRCDNEETKFVFNGVEWTMGNLDGQYAYLEKMLQPIAKAGRLIGLGTGNHGSKVFILTTCNLVMGIAARLGVKYMGYISHWNLIFKYKGKEIGRVKVLTWHGYGGGTTLSSVVNTHEKLRRSFEADLYLTGHWHNPLTFSRVRLDQDGKKTIGKVVWHGSSGSFLRTYIPGIEGYGEKPAYDPNSIGFLRTKILPKKGVISVDFINVDQMGD